MKTKIVNATAVILAVMLLFSALPMGGVTVSAELAEEEDEKISNVSETEEIEATGCEDHTGGTATCHSKAVCESCGSEYGELDPDNHDGGTETKNDKAATCTEAGYTGDTYCLGCSTKIASGKTIKELGHDYSEVVTAPTCTEAGYTTHTCSLCTNHYQDNFTYMPCGDNCTFIIRDNILFIRGAGATAHYKTQAMVPWYDYIDSVTEIRIEEGITEIGHYAFYCLKNVKSIISKNNNLSFGQYVIDKSNSEITIFAEDGGSIEGYCKNNNINYIDPTIKPTAIFVKADSITINAVKGYEYCIIDQECINGQECINNQWQESNEFTDLSPATNYYIYARYAATNEIFDTLGDYLSVRTEKSTPEPPQKPICESNTATTITLKANPDYEYSIDGKNWQKSNVFSNLTHKETYTLYQRFAETETANCSPASEPLEMQLVKKTVSSPEAPVYESHTDNSITLVSNDSYEYSRDGENWQESNEFTDLSKNTVYKFYQRVAETEEAYASEPSAALIVVIPDKPEILEVGSENLLVKKIEGFEYCLDDFEWKDSNSFTQLLNNVEYNVYQRFKKGEGENVYQIVSEPEEVIIDNSIAHSHKCDDWEETTPATCTTAGKKVGVCIDCGQTVEQEIQALGHQWDNGTVTKSATCMETGEKTFTCDNCKATETKEIPVNSNAHTWGDWQTTKNATCTEKGEKQRTCSLCKATETKEIPVNSNAHTWGDWQTTKNATCTKEGSKERVCKHDPVHTETQTIPATGHNIKAVEATAPTATSPGNKEYFKCSTCNKLFTDKAGTVETTAEKMKLYGITYNPNGGKNASNPETYTVESNTITLKAPTRTGYEFKGWYSDKDFKTKVEKIESGSTGNKTFYAQWEIITYSITYTLNGGTNNTKNPADYKVTTATVTLQNPTRKGYTFGGWYSDASFKTKVTQIVKGSTGKKTLYAKWSKNTYKISYVLNGGTNSKNNPTTFTVTSAAITLQKPTKKGYTFGGWYSDASFKTKVTKIAKGSTGKKTFYAKWTINKYTVTYTLNGGANNAKNPASYTVTTATVVLQNPTKKGYTFGGWYSDAKFKTKVTQIAKGSTGNKTLYAKWVKNGYAITYNLNGGTNNAKNPATYTVTTATVTLQNPTRRGFTFGGWYSDASFKTKVTKITKGSTGKKTFYAKWSKITYTITYKLNGGSNANNPKSYTVTTGTITLKNPTKKGYTFGGWYSNASFKTRVTKIAAGSVGSKTFYAKWTKNTYTITYKLNGGANNSANPSTYAVTSGTITLKDPTRKDYVFGGWYSDSNFKYPAKTIAAGSTGNKTFYAKWSLKTYTITYNLDGGTNNRNNPKNYTVKSDITLQNPSKKGYSFKGWYTAGGKKITRISGSSGDLVLYAKWEKLSYTYDF